MNRRNIPVLTSLRFFAATSVVVYHYDHDKHLFPAWASSFGFEAVTFFFVLSGFILTYVHLQTADVPALNVTGRRFLTLRLARILPAYVLALALAFPFFIKSCFFAGTIELNGFLTGLILVPLFAQAWYPPAALLWNAPAWSLSVEWFFYLSFPGIIKVIRGVQPYLLTGFAFVLVAVSQYLNAEISRTWGRPNFGTNIYSFLYYFPIFHIPQFIFGVALGNIFVRRKVEAPAFSEIALSLAILGLIAAVYFRPAEPFLPSNNMALCIIFGLLIFSAAAAAGPISELLSCKPLVLLGEASYATYIIHLPIYMWWLSITKWLLPAISLSLDFTLYFMVVITSSIITLYWIEKPGRRWILLLDSRRKSNLARREAVAG